MTLSVDYIATPSIESLSSLKTLDFLLMVHTGRLPKKIRKKQKLEMDIWVAAMATTLMSIKLVLTLFLCPIHKDGNSCTVSWTNCPGHSDKRTITIGSDT